MPLFFWKDIKPLLLDVGVEEKCIEVMIPEDAGSPARDIFLNNYALEYSGQSYAVAEGAYSEGSLRPKSTNVFLIQNYIFLTRLRDLMKEMLR